MSAPLLNHNAQKWSTETVKPYLNQMEEAAQNEDNLFIGQQLKALGLYSDIWAYWKKKFYRYESLIEHMEIIEGMFESNLFCAALLDKIPAHVAIISLIHAHRWRSYPAQTNKGIQRNINNSRNPIISIGRAA